MSTIKKNVPVGTSYFGVPIDEDGSIGASVYWTTGAFAATFAVQVTCAESVDAPATGANGRWVDAGVTIPAATGAGAGGFMINIENVRQTRARLVVTASVAGDIEVSTRIR